METQRDQNPTQPAPSLAQPLTGVFAVLASLSRIVPHPWNITGVGALGLFAGARLPTWQAFAVPLMVMAATDLVLRALYHNWTPFNPYVYGCFLVNVALGRLLLAGASSPWRIGAVTLLGSVQFFLVTNFGQWLAASVPATQMPGGAALYTVTAAEYAYPMIYYAQNVNGLLACYAAALPFFGTDAPPLGFLGNFMLGDLMFVLVFFGAYAALGIRRPAVVAVTR